MLLTYSNCLWLKYKINLIKNIKRLYNHRGTRYNLDEFNKFYNSHEIICKTITPYSSEMNGRNNRTLSKTRVVILFNLGAVPKWYSETIQIVYCVLNRKPKS